MSKFIAQIQNYQIISSAKLEFDDGLTVIVGDSNNGKTSILRAIEAAIYNKVGNSFIKSGTEATAVGIKIDEHTVIWKKSLDSGVYKIDGETYNKIGRGQLVEVANALNMHEIDVNQDKVRINFLRQMEYPFLLDKNPSQLFEFLSMSNDNDKLSEIFKNMRSDLKQTNSNIDVAIGKIDSYKDVITREEELLKNYDGIDSIADKIISYDSRINSYNSLVNKIDSINSLKSRLLDKRDKVIQLRQRKAEVAPYIESLDKRLDKYNNLAKAVNEATNQVTVLTKKKAKIEYLRQEKSSYGSVLENIDLDKITEKRNKISTLKTKVSSLEVLRTELEHLAGKIKSHRELLVQAKAELNSFSTCPLCGAPLTEQHSH